MSEEKPVITIREETLRQALDLVLGAREHDYGSPSESFGKLAGLWSTFLGVEITASQVVACLALLKLSRLSHSPVGMDSWVDLAGYAALGAEISSQPRPQPNPHDTPQTDAWGQPRTDTAPF